MNQMNRSSSGPWICAAMLIPAVEAASVMRWDYTLAAVLAAGILGMFVSERINPKWIDWVQWMLTPVIMAQILPLTYRCWPGRGAEYAVPGIMLLLTYLGSKHGMESGASAANAVRYPVWLIALSVLLLTVKEVKPERMLSAAPGNTEVLLFVLLLPVLSASAAAAGSWKIWITAMASSVICTGIMAGTGDYYKVSMGTGIPGVAPRMESIASIGIMIGHFITLMYLVGTTEEHWSNLTQKDRKWNALLQTILAACIYAAGLILREWVLCAVLVAVWIILPGIFGKKQEKVLDKRKRRW